MALARRIGATCRGNSFKRFALFSLCVFFTWFVPACATNAAPALRLVGVAKIDVTPDYPVRLSGYGSRTTESEGVEQHIYAKAIAIGSDAEGPAVIITVDNCGLSDAIRAEVVKRLATKTRVTDNHFAIGSSHTHSAPMTGGVLPTLFGRDIPPDQTERIQKYTAELTDKLEQVALTALADRHPAQLAWARGEAGFAMNRRLKTDTGYKNSPNPTGPVDHDLPVLRVTDAQGKVRAVLVNYACHCTTVSFNKICGDWAGYAQEAIERDFPGAVALTIIGCGADQNPNPRGTYELAKQHGEAVATEVKRLLAGTLTPLNSPLECRNQRIALAFDTLPTRAEWEAKAKDTNPYIAYQARRTLAKMDRGETISPELPYLVQTWNFGNDLAMVFLPGEVVVDYALRLKKEYDQSRLWVNSYANDVPCYIPSKRVLTEGGYEGGGAMVYYDRPTKFAADVEDRIIAAVQAQIPKQFKATAPVSEMTAPLSPEAALATFRTKPGFTVELVASEPLIESPVAVDFGPDGKLWVVEMRDYPMGIDGNWKPGGRIKLLEDSKGTGKYDKATVFVDNLPFPTGVMAWGKGILICAAPDIIYAEDTNGDGRADIVRKIFTGFVTDNYQARVNGLSYGLDNWIYGADGLRGGIIKSEATGKTVDISGRDFRMHPDTGEFEAVAGLTQQSRVRNDQGDWFGCDNSNLIWHFPLEDRYVRRNSHVPAPSPRVLPPAGYDFNRLYPASITLERFNMPQSANRTTSACGIGIYRDELLGTQFTGNAFVCEPVHNLVHRLVLEPNGATFKAHRSEDEQQSEFFASTDNWCRPVQARTGPDGAMWIVDMYRFVIEHPRWIPADRLAKLDPRAGADMGRIYRVYPKGQKLRSLPNLTKLSTPELVKAMDTPNGIQRDLAHATLVQRGDKNAFAPLKTLFMSNASAAIRLQALGALDGLHALTPDVLQRALSDADSAVRRHGVRLCEPELARSPALAEAALKVIGDPAFVVRYQLALSLGEWNDPRATQALGDLARKDLGDAWMRAAVLSSAAAHSAEILKAVTTTPGNTPGRGEIIGHLIATAAATQSTESFGAVLQAIAPGENKPVETWQLTALGSLEDALERQRINITTYAGSSNAEIKQAAAQIKHAFEAARQIARDEQAASPAREAAIRLLGRGFNNAAADLPLAVSFVKPGVPDGLLLAALEVIRRNTGAKVPELLLAGWSRQTLALHGSIVDVLITRENWTRDLLSAIEHGTVAASEVSPANKQRLLKHKNDEIKARAEKIYPPNASQARAQVVASYQVVLGLTGNPTKGSEVFAKNCATCHAIGGQGNEVGPDLRPFKNKSIPDYLVAILDPSAAIEPRFTLYQIDTKDDRSLSGVVANETATSLTLVQPNNVRETILRSDITKIKASSLSLMPEGLEAGISPQEMADLIAWIRSTTQ